MNNVHVRSVFSTYDFIVEQNGLRSGYFLLSNQLNPYQWNILCRYLASNSDSLVFQIFCIGNWDERRGRPLLCVRQTGHISESLDTWDKRRSTHWSWASTRSIPLVEAVQTVDQSGYGQFTLFQMLCEAKQTFYLSNFQERDQLVLYSINAKVVPLALRSLSPPGSAAFSCIKLHLLPVVIPVPDSLSHPIPRGNCRLHIFIV